MLYIFEQRIETGDAFEWELQEKRKRRKDEMRYCAFLLENFFFSYKA